MGRKTLRWRMERGGQESRITGWLLLAEGRGRSEPATLNAQGGNPGSQRESEMRTELLKGLLSSPEGAAGDVVSWGHYMGPGERRRGEGRGVGRRKEVQILVS